MNEIKYNSLGFWAEFPDILNSENLRAYLRTYYPERSWPDKPGTLKVEVTGAIVCVYGGGTRLEAMFGQKAFEDFVEQRQHAHDELRTGK